MNIDHTQATIRQESSSLPVMRPTASIDRHAELVSAPISPHERTSPDHTWMLKQVQHDEVLQMEGMLQKRHHLRHPELVSGSSFPQTRSHAR
ncbi:hypothetical protein ACFQFS_11500 [Novosphingobium lubricantis]